MSVREAYLAFSGRRVRVLQDRAGPPLLLIHGIGASADWWLPNEFRRRLARCAGPTPGRGHRPLLNPTPVAESALWAPWNLAAFAGWWARPRTGNLLSYVSFGVIAVDWTIVFYYAFVDNLLGLIYVWTFRKTYHALGGWRFFRIQPDDPDGWSGFGIVHDVEWDVIDLIGLYGVMIALGMGYVGFRGAPVYALFFVIWILFSQLYIWLPRGMIGTILRRHKAAQLALLSQKLKAARASLLDASDQEGSPGSVAADTAAMRSHELWLVTSLYQTTKAVPTELLSIKSKLIVGAISSVLPAGSAVLNLAENHGPGGLGRLISTLFGLAGSGG